MKIIYFLSKITAIALILLPLSVFAGAAGDGFGKLDTGFAGTVNAGTPLATAVRNIVNVFLSIVAIIAAIMIVIGGVQYITAGISSDSNQAAKAKQTVVYAAIGLLVVGLSAALVNFVIGAINRS